MRLSLTLLVALTCAAGLIAQDHTATTTTPPEITLADLDSKLLPLTRSQLKVEADAWLQLVQSTCQGIAEREVRTRATTDAAIRDPLLTEIGNLNTERTARTDRLLRAVASLAAKGGDDDDVKAYRQYATAVSGIKLDVTDTGAAWATVVNWLKSPEGGIRLLKNAVLFLLTLVMFWVFSNIVGRITSRMLAGFRGTSDLLRDFLGNSARRLTFFIGIVLALSMLEVDIGPFLAAIGAAGFVIGFALQGTLSNFASGVMILLYRPYDIGDYVQVAGVAGTVEAMTLVSTSVKSPDNQKIVIPNSSIWGGIITNITGKEMRRVDLKFGVSYSDDLKQVEQVLARVVAEHPLVLKDPAPVIRVHELADSSVNFVVRPWAKTSDYWAVYWDLTRAVKDQFDAAGVSIPFPQRDVHVHQVVAD